VVESGLGACGILLKAKGSQILYVVIMGSESGGRLGENTKFSV